ncbi:hypothetical protein N9S63_01880 [OM182 bacterium]|nr:hypothetical protein [OM182 bacterium]
MITAYLGVPTHKTVKASVVPINAAALLPSGAWQSVHQISGQSQVCEGRHG